MRQYVTTDTLIRWPLVDTVEVLTVKEGDTVMEQTLVGWMFEHPWMTFFTVLAGIAAGEHIAVAIISSFGKW